MSDRSEELRDWASMFLERTEHLVVISARFEQAKSAKEQAQASVDEAKKNLEASVGRNTSRRVFVFGERVVIVSHHEGGWNSTEMVTADGTVTP